MRPENRRADTGRGRLAAALAMVLSLVAALVAFAPAAAGNNHTGTHELTGATPSTECTEAGGYAVSWNVTNAHPGQTASVQVSITGGGSITSATQFTLSGGASTTVTSTHGAGDTPELAFTSVWGHGQNRHTQNSSFGLGSTPPDCGDDDDPVDEPVTAVDPGVAQSAECEVEGELTVPDTTGVQYLLDGVVVSGTVAGPIDDTLTAVALEGYELTNPEWSFDVDIAVAEECEEEGEVGGIVETPEGGDDENGTEESGGDDQGGEAESDGAETESEVHTDDSAVAGIEEEAAGSETPESTEAASGGSGTLPRTGMTALPLLLAALWAMTLGGGLRLVARRSS